ncbi:hypothetical protein BN946_scf185003.g4 [Trametes cinnabarina]|uniref:Integrase core domain-containing protein n=1 Tax=Pycnoporus cinnabarinus TaxID=5643 RepID=A0A060S193_PYCCI|nr:hypothetical protein BN946_scf185003.g4 [Trametes cinnabarina]
MGNEERKSMLCNTAIVHIRIWYGQYINPEVQHDPPDAAPLIVAQPFLAFALDVRGPTRVGKLLQVSSRTVRRRALELGLVEPGPPVFSTVSNATGTSVQVHTTLTNPVSTLTDDKLDCTIANILSIFPNFGRRMIVGHLRAHGHYVPKQRVAAAYVRVRGAPAIFGRCIIIRKKYQVAGPILWSIMMDSMVSSAGKNIRVTEWMETNRGLNRGSYIWGRSVHDTHIERLWYDVTQGFGAKWKSFLLKLEHSHGLDAERPAHIWLVHHLFLNALNADAQEWASTWNAHRLHITGEQAASPRELFMFGMVCHGPRGIEHIANPADDVVEENDVASYGIDWDVNDDPILMAHHQSHNDPVQEVEQGFGGNLGPAELAELVDSMPRRPAGENETPPAILGPADNGLSARSLGAARRAHRRADHSAEQPAQPQPKPGESSEASSLQVVGSVASNSGPADESDSGLSSLTDDSVAITGLAASDTNNLLGSQHLDYVQPLIPDSPGRANTPNPSIEALEDAYVDYEGGHRMQNIDVLGTQAAASQNPADSDAAAASLPASAASAMHMANPAHAHLPFYMPQTNLACQHHLHVQTMAHLPSGPRGSAPSAAVQPPMSMAVDTERSTPELDTDLPSATELDAGLYMISEAVCGYLDETYSAEAALLAQLYSTPPPYGSAYSEVVQIRLICKIFDHLQITTGSRGNRKSTQVHLAGDGSEALTISTLDVIRWARINTLKSYANARKCVTRIHALQHWLKHANSDALDADETRVLDMLTYMCRPDRLPSMQEVNSTPNADPTLAFAVMQAGRPLETVLLGIITKKGIQKAQLPNYTALL